MFFHALCIFCQIEKNFSSFSGAQMTTIRQLRTQEELLKRAGTQAQQEMKKRRLKMQKTIERDRNRKYYP